MRSRPWIAALLALALAAATAAHAQQPPAAPSLPERVIDGVGGAVRGFFKSVFGDRPPVEGEIPSASPSSSAAPASPAAPAPNVATPQTLQAAIARGEYPAAVRMIEQGTDVEAKDDSGAGASALHYAVMKGEMPLVSLLLQHGADVNSRTKSGTTPLHTAVLYRRTEIAEYLIDKGANVNAKSLSGSTPLGLALAANFHTLEDMLRRRGGQ